MRDRANGFTLIEVLVALTLMSSIALAVFGAVRTGMRMTEAAELRAASNQELRLVASLLERAVTRLVPLTTVDSGKRLPHVQGNVDALTLVVDSPPRSHAGGLHEIRLAQERSDSGFDITFTRRLVHPDLLRRGASSVEYLGGVPEVKRVLLRNARFTLDYYGRTSTRAEPRWHDEWDGKRGAPTLVRMRVARGDGKWPEIVAGPRVQRVRYQNIRRGGRDLNDEEPGPEETPQLLAPGKEPGRQIPRGPGS